MERLGKRIAFLATGDEIVNGDILDTNAPYFAEALIDHRFVPGTRLIASDDQKEMENAIRYLLKDHEVLITIGGLGPTSDDRTRFAVSNALNTPLQFDQASWDRLVEKLNSYQLEIPENNRQQCLFPAEAEIYPNPNGTASACCISQNNQLVFMVPGPPNECRAIFKKYILPRLLKTDLQQSIFRRSWMLLGVSEGLIAKTLDPHIEGSGCDIGYRVNHPYLEVKLRSTDEHAFNTMSSLIEPEIAQKLVSRGKQTASDILLQHLQKSQETMSITDQATQGRLASLLLWPKTYDRLSFNGKNSDIEVTLEGLTAYWKNQTNQTAEMPMQIKKNGKTLFNQIINVPIRSERTPKYAAELACECLIRTLKITLNSN